MPLHHQIKIAVLEGVEQGWLPPGVQLPGERELAEALGVSLAPVRQAMADLTKEGYVERTRGKGTFIRDRKLVEKIQILGSFHESVSRQGLNSTVKVLSSEFAEPPQAVAAALALRGQQAWCLRRLAYLDGDPLALLTAWLPPRYARGVSDQDLGTGSLYEALAQVHGVEMTSADNVVEVDRAGLEQAELLGLAPGSPVLQGHRHHQESAGPPGGVLRRALPAGAVPVRDRKPAIGSGHCGTTPARRQPPPERRITWHVTYPSRRTSPATDSSSSGTRPAWSERSPGGTP